jgi:hypothetical protein
VQLIAGQLFCSPEGDAAVESRLAVKQARMMAGELTVQQSQMSD